MDKTYSDLMDIVNRTKKFDSGSTRTVRPRPRPQEVVEENVEEEYVPREYDIEEQEAVLDGLNTAKQEKISFDNIVQVAKAQGYELDFATSQIAANN